MLNEEALLNDLADIGLSSWEDTLLPAIREKLADGAHGHLATWKQILAALPEADADIEDTRELAKQLLQLQPWRKGPFDIRGVHIDAEWRSDLKWNRLRAHIQPLNDRIVLDVGAGNGWYALRMLDAGARVVIGVDPTLLFVAQFAAIRKLAGPCRAHVLPVRLEDLPAESRVFDSTFSMGVLYHRRDPQVHLAQLRDTLKQGGELILETLVIPGDNCDVLEPADRYARMRNVWHLPTIPALTNWLQDAGFEDIQLIDATATTTDEQRSTDWMSFESLADALDPDDPKLTVEGLPAPTRAILTGRAP